MSSKHSFSCPAFYTTLILYNNKLKPLLKGKRTKPTALKEKFVVAIFRKKKKKTCCALTHLILMSRLKNTYKELQVFGPVEIIWVPVCSARAGNTCQNCDDTYSAFCLGHLLCKPPDNHRLDSKDCLRSVCMPK
jgi:hypothetical protein